MKKLLLKIYYILFFGLLIVIIISCRKKLDKEEYAIFVTDPENGFRKTQTIGEFELSVLYEPTDYIVSKEFDKNDESKIESRKKELSEFEHFQFRLKLIEGGNILKYKETFNHNESSRINHFSFETKNDFILVSDSDTLTCKIAIYSRNYNLTPTIDLSLTFDKVNTDEDFRLIYHDQQFDLGKVKFLFKKEDLENIPELKL